MNLLLTQGNALRIPLADESVHCVVTSPPYWGLRKYSGQMALVWGGLLDCAHEWDYSIRPGQTGGHGDKSPIQTNRVEPMFKPVETATCLHCGAWYGELGLEPTPEQYVANMVAVFREVKRVLRPDGTLWLNMGDSYASTLRQYGDKYAGELSQSKRGVLTDIQRPRPANLKEKDLCGIPWRLAFALQADGWWLRSDIIWSKPNPMPESVTDRPTKAHEYLFLLTKSAKYYYDADGVREDASPATKDRDKYDRHQPRSSNLHHGEGYMVQPANTQTKGGRNRRTVWHIATAPYSGAHFATYPPALVEPCIKAGTSERGVCPECGAPWERVVEKDTTYQGDTGGFGDKGSKWKEEDRHSSGYRIQQNLNVLRAQGRDHDNPFPTKTTLGWRPTCDHSISNLRDIPPDPIPATVFDPFAGSGTTLQVARALGRNGVGLDLSLEYLHLARQRLSLDALEAWGKAKKDGASVTDLPMFAMEDGDE